MPSAFSTSAEHQRLARRIRSVRLWRSRRSHTAAHRDSANVVDGGFDAVSVQSLGNLLQSSVCTAMCVRAAVDKKYVHNRYASVLRKKLLLRGKLVHGVLIPGTANPPV